MKVRSWKNSVKKSAQNFSSFFWKKKIHRKNWITFDSYPLEVFCQLFLNQNFILLLRLLHKLFPLLPPLGDIYLFFNVIRQFSLWFLIFSWKNEKSVKSRGRFLIEFIQKKFQYAFSWVQWYLKLWIWSKKPTFRGVAMAPPNRT